WGAIRHSVGRGAKGGTRTLTGVTRWNLNPVRLPIPPLSQCPAIVPRLDRPSGPDRRTRRSAPDGCTTRTKKNARREPGVFGFGGPSRIRTLDLLIKSQLLYQLS